MYDPFHFPSDHATGTNYIRCTSISDRLRITVVCLASSIPFGAIYSLDMMYCSIVTCQLLTHGNDMCIVFSVMQWLR